MEKDYVTIAKMIAINAHTGMTRRGGESYITHPARIANKFKTDKQKAAAWLHDVLEDTTVTVRDLETAGIPKVVIDAVVKLTHLDTDTYEEYLEKVKTSNLATEVKIGDLQDNISDDPSRNQMIKYARAFLFLVD